MTRKMNVDEQAQLAEPIEVVLEGKTYTIEKVTLGLMSKVEALKDDKSLDVPAKQLALLLNTNSEELSKVDIRKIGKALSFITEILSEGIPSKNP